MKSLESAVVFSVCGRQANSYIWPTEVVATAHKAAAAINGTVAAPGVAWGQRVSDMCVRAETLTRIRAASLATLKIARAYPRSEPLGQYVYTHDRERVKWWWLCTAYTMNVIVHVVCAIVCGTVQSLISRSVATTAERRCWQYMVICVLKSGAQIAHVCDDLCSLQRAKWSD